MRGLPDKPTAALIAANPHIYGETVARQQIDETGQVEMTRFKAYEGPEKQLQKECSDWLRKSGPPHLVIWHRMDMPSTTTEGVPDWIIFLHNRGFPSVICVEAKNKVGVMSEKQTAWETKVRGLGHPYFLIRSLEEFQYVVLKPC